MPILDTTVRYCIECATATEWEQPPCVDGHGADCPEWICCSCGAAVVTVVAGVVPVRAPAAIRGAA